MRGGEGRAEREEKGEMKERRKGEGVGRRKSFRDGE